MKFCFFTLNGHTSLVAAEKAKNRHFYQRIWFRVQEMLVLKILQDYFFCYRRCHMWRSASIKNVARLIFCYRRRHMWRSASIENVARLIFCYRRRHMWRSASIENVDRLIFCYRRPHMWRSASIENVARLIFFAIVDVICGEVLALKMLQD